VVALPSPDQLQDRTQPLAILRGIMVDRHDDVGVAGLRDRCRQIGMPVQEESVGDDADVTLWPMAANGFDERRKVRMDRGLAAKQSEIADRETGAPQPHPLICFRKRHVATMVLVRVV
jgi:hypothetical protein